MSTPAYVVTRERARREALEAIDAQVASGKLVIRQLTAADLEELERARKRRLDVAVTAAVVPTSTEQGLDDDA